MLDAAWQASDQVTITVPKDMLPDVVEFLYYGRGGWLPNMVANDERPLNGRYALYYLLSMEEADPGFVTVRTEIDPPLHGIPLGYPARARLRVERA